MTYLPNNLFSLHVFPVGIALSVRICRVKVTKYLAADKYINPTKIKTGKSFDQRIF